MSRRIFPLTMALLVAAGACGPAEVVVTLEIDMGSAEGGTVARALGDIEVQLLPYDRDVVFDSMAAAFADPEPEIPQDLMEARDAVRQAQERWQAAERRWNDLRDTLQKLNTTMQQYSSGEARYAVLYREWEDFDADLRRVQRAMDSAFREFTDLQVGTNQQADSVRILQDNWADEAFAGVGEIFLARSRLSGLQVQADTSDASGIARFDVKPGDYWLHARYELPFSELYWNVPVSAERGDPIEVRLTRENAEERIKL